MNYECVDVDSWYRLKESTKGSREKQWILKPSPKQPPDEVEIFLFKESSKRYPAEFWAEIIASKVGKIVGVQTPETHCAKWGDKYAALIKFFLKMEWDEKEKRFQQVEVLFEGGDAITGMDPTFDRKEGERHNIFQVERIFSMIEKEQLFKEFLKILIFDALIGNTDRHQDNWGFIGVNETHAVHLAPAFDNSTSLASELVEEKLSGYLAQNEVKLRQYISKGKAHIRWSADGVNLIRLNHFQLLKNIAQQKSFLVDDIKGMTRFTNEQIEVLLDGLAKIEIGNPKYRLSETRRNPIKRIICLRRDLLKEEFRLP